MKQSIEYYESIRRQLAHEAEVLESDISLVQHDGLREIAREMWIEKSLKVIELERRFFGGGEEDGVGGRED